MVWLEFYFLFIKFPPKFKRTGSAYKYFEFECLLNKLYKYECCTITGIWKQGSAYFVVKPIKYGLVLTFFIFENDLKKLNVF
jgi:hypothetical protein